MSMTMGNRKLIRPEVARNRSSRTVRRKQSPPEQTNAEEFYYLKQMAAKTPMVVVLNTARSSGLDRVVRQERAQAQPQQEPNLLILKHNIRYMFKEEELRRQRRRAQRTGKKKSSE